MRSFHISFVEPLELGEYQFLGTGSKVIGGGKIGNRASIGANALIRNPNIQDDFIAYQDVKIGMIMQKHNKKEICIVRQYYFDK